MSTNEERPRYLDDFEAMAEALGLTDSQLLYYQILNRMAEGQREYGDESYHRTHSEIYSEVQEEAIDIIGWLSLIYPRVGKHTAAEIESICREAARLWRRLETLQDSHNIAQDVADRVCSEILGDEK